MVKRSSTVSQPPLVSSFSKQPLRGSPPPSYLASHLARFTASTAIPSLAALAYRFMTHLSYLLTHLSLPALQLLWSSVGATSSSLTTSATKASTLASIAGASPIVLHPPWSSRAAKQTSNLLVHLLRHSGSATAPIFAAFV